MTKETVYGGIGLCFHSGTEIEWALHPIVLRQGEDAIVRDTVQMAYDHADRMRSELSIDAPIAGLAMLWLVATYQQIHVEEPDDRLMYLANAMRTICGLDYFVAYQDPDGALTIVPVKAPSHDAAMQIIKEKVMTVGFAGRSNSRRSRALN